jgi:hypothetical protein
MHIHFSAAKIVTGLFIAEFIFHQVGEHAFAIISFSAETHCRQMVCRN